VPAEEQAHSESLEQHEHDSDQEYQPDDLPKPPSPGKGGHLRIVK
jgi:hypothetical protein